MSSKSKMADFWISGGVLTRCNCKGGDIVLPDTITGCDSVPFMGVMEPFRLTLSGKMKCNIGDLLSEQITVLNIPAGTQFECSSCGPGHTSFYKKLEEINVDPDNPYCASKDGILYSKDMKTLYACPAAYKGPVVIPDTVEKIGPGAFDGCRQLKEIVIPDSVVEIDSCAFMDCTALKKVILSDNLRKMEKETFLRCSKLTTAGPKGTSKGKGYCLEFPWTEEIPENAFAGMNKLKSVVLPDTIKKVGKNAFKGCKSLEEINVPANVQYDKKLFKDCKSLSLGAVPKSDFVIQNGCLVAYQGEDSAIVIPDSVTEIGRRAFYNNRALVEVVIPETVEKVGQEAFSDCYALEKVTIKGKIKAAGVRAFGWLHNETLEQSIYSAVPMSVFTKSAQETVLRAFSMHFSDYDPNTDVFRDNLEFIGKHLKQEKEFSGNFYQYLVENEALRHAVLNAGTIPMKDVDWLLAELQKDDNKEFIAELLEYKNRQLQDPKVKEAAEKAKAREEDKALSAEMSAADWRKLLKFGYEDGSVVIKEVMIKEPVVELPDHIGSKKVRVIDRRAFAYNRKKGEKEIWCPEKIILPEGIEEIRRGAFFCVDKAEVFIPSTVTSLPEGCFVAAYNVTVHIPSSVVEIADELEFDSWKPFKAFCAPSGSYAEKYAKEHNIPFVAE